MALYLGNQKVSLRSGQDPTFDYGFDSNGRLVFANKNATEINNFLNYDSSYSEILDLSNLSKMEKVSVNGTVNRKMEGLKGLLVSPNAPFTGSSPQINVSYTGLSKSSLVSLFESTPYNVGYTKVGSPIIVNGVASGFSSSDYLTMPSFNPGNNPWEMVLCFNTPKESDMNSWGVLFGTKNANQKGIRILSGISGGSKYFQVIFTGPSGRIGYIGEQPTATPLQPNTKTWIKTIFNGSVYKVYTSLNGSDYTEVSESVTSSTSISSDNSEYHFGEGLSSSSASISYTGSIDLNETYIKVNGVTWFSGKPAITKTCSIVGATGTADLTQEDKNIILNKGWSLTVQ